MAKKSVTNYVLLKPKTLRENKRELAILEVFDSLSEAVAEMMNTEISFGYKPTICELKPINHMFVERLASREKRSA